MALSQFPQFLAPTALMQRSLSRGRLGHAYLVAGDTLDDLETFALHLAKTLNCETNAAGFTESADACDSCLSCRKIDQLNHADVRWVRPESKTRQISVDQVRDVLQTVYLKSTESVYKVVNLVAADRLTVQASNAFLKTLEEPPKNTIFMLLTTEPSRVLETIRSRCQRLFCGTGAIRFTAAAAEWVEGFSERAAGGRGGLFARYHLLDELLQQLATVKAEVTSVLSERSPMEQYDDVDPKLVERWKAELAASIEAEYRRRRSEILAALQMWFRDVWLFVQGAFTTQLAAFPHLDGRTEAVARRIDSRGATRNLEVLESTQRLLFTNVQEALALEIGLLKLSL